MEPRKGQFPEGWQYSQVPDHYYYGSIFVQRIDRGHGMIELVGRTEYDQRISVLAKGLWSAMNAFERKLCKESEINL